MVISGGTAQVSIRVPRPVLTAAQALGLNRSDAAVQGILTAVCDALGVPDAAGVTPAVEGALIAALQERRRDLTAAVAELDALIETVQNRAATRLERQQAVAAEAARQQQQAVAAEAVGAARTAFDAVLATLPEPTLQPLLTAVAERANGDAVHALATAVVADVVAAAAETLQLPPGADPVQWVVDYAVGRVL